MKYELVTCKYREHEGTHGQHDGAYKLNEHGKCDENEKNAGHADLVNRAIVAQSLPTLIFSLMALLLTSVLLDRFQHWPVFRRCTELLLMMPVLMNLKGNLETSLTGRLVQSVYGDGWWSAVWGNAWLLAAQSATSSLLVGWLTVALAKSIIHQSALATNELWLIVAVPVMACLSSALVIWAVLVGTVWVTVSCAWAEPDNVAVPIANALGDCSLIIFLSIFARLLEFHPIACILIIVSCTVLIIVSMYKLMEDECLNEIFWSGWIPIISALLITSLSGLILERSHSQLPSLPILLPVVNGITGGLFSIYTCRLMTSDKKRSFSAEPMSTPITLLLMNLPLQCIFLLCIHAFPIGHNALSSTFISGLLCMTIMHTMIMLYLSKKATDWCINEKIDISTFAMPCLSAISDLIGTILLIILLNMLR